MAVQWQYRIFGEEFGPVSEATLRGLVADGTLGPADEIRSEGDSDWRTADILASEPDPSESDAAFATDLDDMLAAPAFKQQTVSAGAGNEGGVDLDSMLAPSMPQAKRKAEANDWFYRVGGRRFGPVDFDTLFEHAAEGRFSRYDEIRAPGDDKWVEAQSMVGLFARDEPDLDALLGEEKPLPSAPAAKKQVVKETWYYRVLNQVMGPVDFEALFDLVIEGNLRPDDDVRGSRQTEWQRADSLVGLFPDEMLETTPATAPVEEVSEVDEGDAEWYLRCNGQIAGPVTFGRLVDMAGKGQLQRQHEIRLTKLGAWMEADSMVGLFPEEEQPVEVPEAPAAKPAPPKSNVPEKPTGDADDWAAAVLSEPGAEPAKPKPQYDAQPAYVPSPALSPPTLAAASRPTFQPPPKASRKSSGGGLSLPSGLGGAVSDPKVLIGVGAVVLVVAMWFVPWGSIFAASSSDLIADLDEIWGQTKALYDKKAPDAEWTTLEGQVEPKLKEIAQTATDRGAGPANPGLQIAQMLANKHIPAVLSKKSEATDTQVRTVDNFLTRAKEL